MFIILMKLISITKNSFLIFLISIHKNDLQIFYSSIGTRGRTLHGT